ncbi:hypothetical protein BDZ91DRAFT_767953 [Kalaharituber pfeilii]|nr:hypothetical protein BDZ91DRAFT_767953 [Kalaharituber pfeilii]
MGGRHMGSLPACEGAEAATAEAKAVQSVLWWQGEGDWGGVKGGGGGGGRGGSGPGGCEREPWEGQAELGGGSKGPIALAEAALGAGAQGGASRYPPFALGVRALVWVWRSEQAERWRSRVQAAAKCRLQRLRAAGRRAGGRAYAVGTRGLLTPRRANRAGAASVGLARQCVTVEEEPPYWHGQMRIGRWAAAGFSTYDLVLMLHWIVSLRQAARDGDDVVWQAGPRQREWPGNGDDHDQERLEKSRTLPENKYCGMRPLSKSGCETSTVVESDPAWYEILSFVSRAVLIWALKLRVSISLICEMLSPIHTGATHDRLVISKSKRSGGGGDMTDNAVTSFAASWFIFLIILLQQSCIS